MQQILATRGATKVAWYEKRVQTRNVTPQNLEMGKHGILYIYKETIKQENLKKPRTIILIPKT